MDSDNQWRMALLDWLSVITTCALSLSFTSCEMRSPLAERQGERLSGDEATVVIETYRARPVAPWPSVLPTLDDIPEGPEGDLIHYGIALLERTPELVGPNVPEASRRIAHNNLACVQCHPAGPSGLPGTRPGRLPWVNVVNDYPKLDVKTMRVMSLEDRVRGMFGGGRGQLTDDSRELRAIRAYFEFLGRSVEPGHQLDGSGIAKADFSSRAADPERGRELYNQLCAACHISDGRGQKKPGFERGAGYEVPAIAGDDSYDDGGHMYMVPVFARFILGYMPPFEMPEPLTPDDALDIAAYVNGRLPRRSSPTRALAYPDARFRPAFFAIPELFDHDPAAQARAKYGPFTRAELEAEF